MTLLLLSTGLVHWLLPRLVRSDGTGAGWREMFVRAVPGAVFCILLLAILVCACGAFARERESRRLTMATVRPVSLFAVACGQWLALCVVAAVILGLNAVLTWGRLTDAPVCSCHTAPALPPAVEVARTILDDYLKDPKTPEPVRQAPRAAVLSLLTSKESDRYDAIAPGQTHAWPFPASLLGEAPLTIRVRFATAYDMRSSLKGVFSFGSYSAAVTNATQNFLDIPLVGAVTGMDQQTGAALPLTFTNMGDESVMLRPRRDLEILVPADAFALNLLRASVEMLSIVALLAAFGMFLSAALSRPVSIFTAIVVVLVTLMAPSVVEQFPDELNVSLANRLGLAISRAVHVVTSAVADLSPLEDVATDTCIEVKTMARSLVANALVVPLGLLALAALIVRRKPLDAQ